MIRVIKLINHTPSEYQIKQLMDDWNVSQIIDLPSQLAYKFSNVPPEEQDLRAFAMEFINWIKGLQLSSKEPIWIQGESGLSFLLIQNLLNENYTVIHATTKRDVVEENGVKKSIFKHHRFRKFQTI